MQTRPGSALRTATLAATTLTGLTGFAAPAYAGGFYLQEQSPVEVGRAFSGEAASADNPSTIFFNPAGMTELEGIQIDGGVHVLFVNSQQRNTGTTRSVPGLPTPFPVQGGDGGNPFGQPIAAPSLYVSAQLSDRLWAGLGVSSPFGLIVDYDDDFFGRYDSLRSDVFTVNVQPSLAYKVNDWLSVGGGIDVQYIDVELINAVPNLSPASPDGRLRVTGDDISVGFNAGFTVRAKDVRLGAHYRSQMEHKVDGSFDLSGLTGPLAGNNGVRDARAPITLPDIVTVSALFGVDKPLRFMASWRWYNWSDFEEIAIFPDGLPPQVSEQNYRNSWSMAAGVEYDASDALTLRAGTMYDESPITDAFRTTRVPDGDRTWLTAGVSYDLGERFTANFAYAHVFVTTEPLDRTDRFFDGTPAAIDSTIRSVNSGDADILALSVTAKL